MRRQLQIVHIEVRKVLYMGDSICSQRIDNLSHLEVLVNALPQCSSKFEKFKGTRHGWAVPLRH